MAAGIQSGNTGTIVNYTSTGVTPGTYSNMECTTGSDGRITTATSGLTGAPQAVTLGATVSSTLSETSVVGAVQAGSLSWTPVAAGGLIVMAIGTCSGSPSTMRWKFKKGSTLILDSGVASAGGGSLTGVCSLLFEFYCPTTTTIMGQGSLSHHNTSQQGFNIAMGTSPVTISASAETLDITFQMGSSTANAVKISQVFWGAY